MSYKINKADINKNLELYSVLLEKMYKEESLYEHKSEFYVKLQDKLKVYKKIVESRLSNVNSDSFQMYELVENDTFSRLFNSLTNSDNNEVQSALFLVANLNKKRVHIPEVLIISENLLNLTEEKIYKYIINFMENEAVVNNYSEISYEYCECNESFINQLSLKNYDFHLDNFDENSNVHLATKKIVNKEVLDEEGYNCTRQRKKSN